MFVDQLLDDDRLAHTGTTVGTDLATPGEGCDEVDNLQAGFPVFCVLVSC